MSKSSKLIAITIIFAAGVLLGSVIAIPPITLYLALAAAICLFAILVLAKNEAGILAVGFLLCLLLGIMRLNMAKVPSEYSSIFNTKQQMEGLIVEDVDIRQDHQLLTIRPFGYGQNILATVPKTSQYFYGDWVALDGKITEPKSFNDFDYKKYLEHFNVYAVSDYPKVLILKNHRGNAIKESLLRIKAWFVGAVANRLSEPKSSLLLGILIGAKRAIPQNILDEFTVTGTSHIVAISGYNVSVIVGALSYLVFLFGRRTSFWLSLVFIAGFVILSGASASVIRAAIMGALLLIALNIGRQYAMGPSLFFAALIMILINPKILYWDISFQLSFFATLGIIYGMPPLEKLTERWENPLKLKSILFTTMTAIVATLPLILFYFGQLSLVAPLSNLLILPVLPYAMLAGFLSVLPLLGRGFAFFADILLSYVLKVEDILSRWPHASVPLKISSLLFAVLSGLVVVAFVMLHDAAGWKRKSAKPVAA